MDNLTMDLVRLTQRNRDGSYGTQTNRKRGLTAMANDLSDLGYKLPSAASLKPKHIEALVEKWLDADTTDASIRNRLTWLRWWAEKVNKPNVVNRDNAAYGVAERGEVTRNRAQTLDPAKFKAIECPYIQASLLLQAAFGLRRAQMMFPHDPRAPSFFMDDAVGIMTGFMLYTLLQAPPHRRTLATVCQMAMLKEQELLSLARAMLNVPASHKAGKVIMAKDAQRGLKVLQESLSSKLYEWGDPDIQRSLSGNDVNFESLKDRTATVYVEIPFHKMTTFSGYLRVVLKAALDAMLANPKVPHIPVLFVMDEFLNIGPFPEYRDAIRTHAGAGVRLWFFLQDIYSIEQHYPGNSWRPFLNCAVKQFFGINDLETAKMVGDYLGHKTHAVRTTSSSTNVSSHLSGWMGDGSTNSGFSMTEGIQFLGRPLMTPDEIKELLSGWQGDGWRYGITDMPGVRPFKTQLVVHEKSENCRQRAGMMTKGEWHDRADISQA